MNVYLYILIIIAILLYFPIQIFRFKKLIRKKERDLLSYNPEIINLSYGCMTYVDRGAGDVILSIHGIFGGYDQAFNTCKDFASEYRIIAPSRFGYIGSDIKGNGTPKEQVEAYVELLDRLGIEKVFLLSTSAGGSVALRFALDHPERTKGLILYCSAVPGTDDSKRYSKYAGPPAFICNDYLMYLFCPLFKYVLGMEPSTINDMLPIKARKKGVILDSYVTNTDMVNNVDNYNIQNLKIPTLVLHSKDDKLVKYSDVEKTIHRIPDCTFIIFETGGHLMKGHEDEVKIGVSEFIENHKKS